MNNSNRIWKEGYDHRSYGGRYADSPYAIGTVEHRYWSAGYQYAKDIQYIWTYTA